MFIFLLLLPAADSSMREIIEQERMRVLIEMTRKELAEQKIPSSAPPLAQETIFTADPPEDYQKLMAQAARENRPLIVLVNTDGQRNPNYLYYKTTKFESYSQPTTIISLPNQGTMFWMTTLNRYDQTDVDKYIQGYWNPTMIKKQTFGYAPTVQQSIPVQYQMDCSSGTCRLIPR